MLHTELKLGDKVEFPTRKGRKVGIVANVRTKKPRGKNAELCALFGDTGERLIAQITVEGHSGYFECGASACTVIEGGNYEAAAESREKIANVKEKLRDNKNKVASMRFQAADENNLTSLRLGDPIVVAFRDCKRTCSFEGFVKSSGNVRFLHQGRIRTTSPKFVTLPEAK